MSTYFKNSQCSNWTMRIFSLYYLQNMIVNCRITYFLQIYKLWQRYEEIQTGLSLSLITNRASAAQCNKGSRSSLTCVDTSPSPPRLSELQGNYPQCSCLFWISSKIYNCQGQTRSKLEEKMKVLFRSMLENLHLGVFPSCSWGAKVVSSS